jgi:hypothetical protein
MSTLAYSFCSCCQESCRQLVGGKCQACALRFAFCSQLIVDKTPKETKCPHPKELAPFLFEGDDLEENPEEDGKRPLTTTPCSSPCSTEDNLETDISKQLRSNPQSFATIEEVIGEDGAKKNVLVVTEVQCTFDILD